jgi:hypothetical protein
LVVRNSAQSINRVSGGLHPSRLNNCLLTLPLPVAPSTLRRQLAILSLPVFTSYNDTRYSRLYPSHHFARTFHCRNREPTSSSARSDARRGLQSRFTTTFPILRHVFHYYLARCDSAIVNYDYYGVCINGRYYFSWYAAHRRYIGWVCDLTSCTDSIKNTAATMAYDMMLNYKGNVSGGYIGVLPGPPPDPPTGCKLQVYMTSLD